MGKEQRQQRFIGIQRTAFLSGKRKIGLDTNVLIKLYDSPALFSYEEARIFNRRDVIFTHRLCFLELVKYIKKKGFDENEANHQARDFLNSHNIKEICYFVPDEEIKKFEQESNEKFKQMNKENLKCHLPDSIILLSFKKVNINKVISTDESFTWGAKFLGIDEESLPSLDYAISRELRKIFDYKKRFQRKRR